MEKNFLPLLNGPSWMIKSTSKSSRWKSSYSQFPINDGMSVLPVLENVESPVTYKTKDGGMESFLSFQPKKFIDKEFPIKKCIPCFLPFDTEENESTFLNCNDENFYDNKIDSFSDGISQYLVYTKRCNEKNQIVMSNIKNNDKISVNFCLKDTKVIAEYQDICQLGVKYICDEVNILIRSPERISLHFTHSNSESSIPLSKTKYSSLHPFLKGHFSVVDSSSAVHFYNIENGKSLWNGTSEDHTSHDKNASVFECHFANHPSHLYTVSNTDVWLADMRISANRMKNIFNIESMKNSIHCKQEEILSLKEVNNLPYFYTICNQSVVLMDNRCCKEPILTWLHMMRCKPKFCQFYNGNNNIKGLILADSSRGSFTIIPTIYSNSDGDIPSASTISTPKHFNILKDTLSHAHFNNRWHCQNVLQRVKQPLVGMTISLLSENSKALLCFQNNVGLLFYQIIRIADSKSQVSAAKGKLCNFNDYDTTDDFTKSHLTTVIASLMKKYENKVRFSQQHHSLKKVVEGIPFKSFLKPPTDKRNRTIYISKFEKNDFPFWDIRKSNLIGTISDESKLKKLLNYEIDTTSLESRECRSEKLEANYLHNKYANINPNSMAIYLDSLSKTLLNPWLRYDKEFKATIKEKKFGYSFKRHPPKTAQSSQFTFPLSYVDMDRYIKIEADDLTSPEISIPNEAISLSPRLPSNVDNFCTPNKREIKKPRRSAVQGF